ncbi:MAG: (2Fe-2S)-binding protein [Myxococcales bacterium]|nr:(2Fe-2S)-binding protein [Myxococcales bacterium]
MLICHCKKVTDATIREAVKNGARSRGLVGRVCGAGTCCGGCLPAVDEILQAEREETPRGLPMLAVG